MGRAVLFIFILTAVMLSIFFGAMLSYVITLNMSAPDMREQNMINLTSAGNGTSAYPIAANIQISRTSEEGENIGRIASVPKKCLGSALCPD